MSDDPPRPAPPRRPAQLPQMRPHLRSRVAALPGLRCLPRAAAALVAFWEVAPAHCRTDPHGIAMVPRQPHLFPVHRRRTADWRTVHASADVSCRAIQARRLAIQTLTRDGWFQLPSLHRSIHRGRRDTGQMALRSHRWISSSAFRLGLVDNPNLSFRNHRQRNRGNDWRAFGVSEKEQSTFRQKRLPA